MRSAVDCEREADPAGAARRALDAGADEVVVTFGKTAPDPRALARLRALGRVRLRATVAVLGDAVRSIARAGAIGLPVEVVLPIAEGLRSAAGRLHGLARATPDVIRYLLAPVPDDAPLRSPEAIAGEVEDAQDAARELAVVLVTDDDTRVDTELHAVLAAIKPVIRLSTEGTDEATIFARYARFGLVSCAGDGRFIDETGEHGRSLRLVYVARSLELAERARAAEARTFVGTETVDERARHYRMLGLALGYPPCCVDAYVARVVVAGERLAEAFVAVRGAWHASPSWLLDHLLFETGDALITFSPCNYACSAARAYASAVLTVVESEAPLAADRLRRRLAVDVAVDRTGARAILTFDGDELVAARPRRRPDGGYVHAADVELARRLVARERDDPSPIIVRFGSSPAERGDSG